MLTIALALAVGAALGAPPPDQQLTAGDAGDRFGHSVAIDGDTAVVGAPSALGNNGAVYVFERVNDNWVQSATLVATSAASSNSLGWSVAIDGDTIVAGAHATGPPQNRGAVFTFAREGAALRNEIQKLTAADGGGGDFLGWSVDVDGDTIVAGARGEGAAYTFTRSGGGGWSQSGKLTASDGVPGSDRLGTGVAIDGDTIVAGAPEDDLAGGLNHGSVYTFARTGSAERTETAKLTASDAASDDQLGISVAIEGETIVAGAHRDDAGTSAQEGSLYTFARTGLAARTETAKLTASDGVAEDRLGSAVALDGETIVAGAPHEIGDAGDEGSIYTFDRTGAAAREETSRLSAADAEAGDQFGSSVAIDSFSVFTGAPFDDVGIEVNQGSAWALYFEPEPGPSPSPSPSPTPSATPLPDPTNQSNPGPQPSNPLSPQPLAVPLPQKPTIQVVPASPRSQGARAARTPKTAEVQLSRKWIVKWSGAAAVDSFDVWYQRVPSGGATPDWEDDFADTGSLPSIARWRDDVTAKQAKFTAVAGLTYCFGAAANDAGASSPPEQVCTTLPHKAKSLDFTKWKKHTGPGHYEGGYVRFKGPVYGSRLRAALVGEVGEMPRATCFSAVVPNGFGCPETVPYEPLLGSAPWCGPGNTLPGCIHTVELPPAPQLKRVVLVATKCASCGKLLVNAFGRRAKVGEPLDFDSLRYPVWQKTVNLQSSRTRKKQLIPLKTYPSSDAFQGWFVKFVPASGHPRIEGLALVSRKRLPPQPAPPGIPF